MTRSGGPEEIITHGENGWIVDAANHTAIARALERLADDRGLRTALAEKGRRRAEDTFGIDAMLAGYERVYDGLG